MGPHNIICGDACVPPAKLATLYITEVLYAVMGDINFRDAISVQARLVTRNSVL